MLHFFKRKWKYLSHVQIFGAPGSSVHGVLQGWVLKWVAISFYMGSSQSKDQTPVSCIQADSLPSEPPGKLK